MKPWSISYYRNQHQPNSKCSCGCAEQLQKANLKIESLEKKIKLLLEENKVSFKIFHLKSKILKYLATDPKENQFKTEFSTNSSNAQLNVQTKSLFEKSVNTHENYTPPDHYDELNELPEKNVVSNSNSSLKFSQST